MGEQGNGQLVNNTTTNSPVPVEVSYNGSFLSGSVEVAASAYSSYTLAGDGSLYVWDRNTYGELGIGNTTDQLNPFHLLPPSGQFYELINSGGDSCHALAILGDTAPVPEPGTWVGGALLVGAAGLSLHCRCAAYQVRASAHPSCPSI